MFKIHRRIEYALLALKYMSRKFPGQITSAKEICEHFHIPFDPTSRVLQIMAQKQIVKAEQGARGGYQIIQDLSKITMQELSQMLVGPFQVTACLEGKDALCEARETCEISNAMFGLNQRVQQFFASITVADMTEQNLSAKHRVAAPATPSLP